MLKPKKRSGVQTGMAMIIGLCLITGIYQSVHAQSKAGVNASYVSADNEHVLITGSSQQQNSAEYKSKTRAVLYGVASTTIPVGLGLLINNEIGGLLLGTGVAIGPSVGIAYAGDIKRAGTGVAVRGTGAGMSAIGMLLFLDDLFGGDGNNAVGSFLILGGYTVIGGSTIYDLFIASPRAVERYNEQVEKNRVRLNPWINPDNRGAGLSLSVRF